MQQLPRFFFIIMINNNNFASKPTKLHSKETQLFYPQNMQLHICFLGLQVFMLAVFRVYHWFFQGVKVVW